MKNRILLFVFLCALISLVGCATTSPVKEESPYPTSLGDFSPFKLGDAFSLWKSGDDVSPCEMTIYCVPRVNEIEIHFSKLINKVCLMLDAEDCDNFAKNVEAYMNDYNSNGFDKNYKPKKENSYGKMTPGIAWGVFGYSYNTEIEAFFNYEIIGGKPYFSMYLDQEADSTSSDVYSPIMTMYFTPDQLETIMEMTSSEVIDEYIKSLEEEAYHFDYEF